MSPSNTDNGILYGSLLTDDPGENTGLYLYKDSGKDPSDEVAGGTRLGAGTITLNESEGSGLSGTCSFDGYDSEVTEFTFTLECP